MAFAFVSRVAPFIGYALNQGWKASVILNHLSHSSKKIADAVGLSKKSGYSDEKILEHMIDVAKSPRARVMKGGGYYTSEEKRQNALDAGKKALKTLGAAAAIGGAAYGAYKYKYPGAVQPSQILPAQPQGPGPQRMLPGPQRQLTSPAAPVPPQRQLTTPSPTGPTIVPPGPMITPPPGTPAQQRANPFSNMNINPSAGLTPGRAISQQATQPIAKPIIPPAPQARPQQQMQPQDQLGQIENVIQGMGAQQQPEIPAPEAQFMPREAKPYGMPIEKGSQVFNPKTGNIATIEDKTAKNLKINSEGKKDIIPIDDAIPMPDDQEELGQIYRTLIDKIPEGHKSRMADYIGYDPDNNSVLITFHDGKSYTYNDVPEEIVKEIVNSDHFAKTTGGNFIGRWYKDNPSIGAGVVNLIKDLQSGRGGKGNEFSSKHVELFSMHRLPKQQLKAIHEREKAQAKSEKATKPTNVSKNVRPEKPKEPAKEVKPIAKTIEKAKHQDISPESLRRQKKYLVEKLEDAIKHPKDGSTVLIKVPEDGQFQVRNKLDSLKKALGKVKKDWPIHPIKPA